jgi:hypothetical protein
MAGETLKAIHETADEIPELYRDLYSERGGKWELTGIAGVKTDADVARVQEALRKEKEDHKKAKEAARVWNEAGWKFDEVQERMDKWDELTLQAQAGKIDDEKVNQIVESRIKARISPVEREKQQLAEKLAEAGTVIQTFQEKERVSAIHNSVRETRAKLKYVETAEEDILLLAERMLEIDDSGNVVTKDGVGVTPGISPDIWLQEMQTKRPHWWPESQGGGAKGGKAGNGFASNPWSAANWNLTAQGAYITANGVEKAQQMAAAAGSTVGAIAPKKAA